MVWISSRKDKETFLITILEKLNIDENERDLYILSIEILDDNEFTIFFDRIVEQVTENWFVNNEIERKKIAPFSTNIL
jgi:hypothetical protein